MKTSRRIFGLGVISALFASSVKANPKPTRQRIVVKSHDGKIMADVQPGNGKTIVWKIGSDDRPATDDDIADFQNSLAAVCHDPTLMIVTHHLVSVEVV